MMTKKEETALRVDILREIIYDTRRTYEDRLMEVYGLLFLPGVPREFAIGKQYSLSKHDTVCGSTKDTTDRIYFESFVVTWKNTASVPRISSIVYTRDDSRVGFNGVFGILGSASRFVYLECLRSFGASCPEKEIKLAILNYIHKSEKTTEDISTEPSGFVSDIVDTVIGMELEKEPVSDEGWIYL